MHKNLMSKECIAMLLAGGQGSRLAALTEKNAKPAVPFGGKYRIIDFPLSNCVNSGIDTVGIMTQYQPLELNEYIGSGSPWGLNRSYGGVHILPPYSKSKKSEWYKGTANAIYQNIRFVDRYNPRYVLVLSGDHIYKMDYSKMLAYHKEHEAQCTIAVIDVPLSEASRFGIMNTRDDGSIYEFCEKPKKPKSTKASMGVYLFDWDILRQYLIDDEHSETSSHDFGKDVIPRLVSDRKRLFAYSFDGYWKDVGTIESLWEANMDLVATPPPIEIKDPDFRIYARNYALPTSYIAEGAHITDSLVAEGCRIAGAVRSSVVSTGCTVEKGALVEKSFIMPGSRIREGAVVVNSIVCPNCTIGKGALIGCARDDDDKRSICVIARDLAIADGETVK